MSAGRIAALASALAVGALANINPCLDPADYDDTATMHSGSVACSDDVQRFSPFTPDATTCFEDVALSDASSTYSRAFWLEYMAPCCGYRQTACAPYVFNPCANASAFNPATVLGGEFGGRGTCGIAAASTGAAFVASVQTCEEEVVNGGFLFSRKSSTANLARDCCDDREDVCAAFSMNPCANAASFDGTVEVHGQTCSAHRAQLGAPFTPSAQACEEEVQTASGEMFRRKQLMSMLAPCCDSQGDACAATLMNPCANAASFDGAVQVHGQPCSWHRAQLGAPFQPSAQTCDQEIPNGDGGTMQRKALTNTMAACCAGGDVCAQYIFNPCATPGSFNRDAIFGDEGRSCAQMMDYIPRFTPSAATCLEEVALSEDSNATARSAIMAQVAAVCCTGGVSVCAQHIFNPCEDTAHFNPAATFDWDSEAVNCSTAAASIPRFTVSAATCAEEITVPDAGEQMARSALASRMSSCCGGNPVVCQTVSDPVGPVATELQFVVNNIDYDALIADGGALQTSFKDAILDDVMTSMPAGITRDMVEIVLSAGSVRVTVVITPTSEATVSVAEVTTSLADTTALVTAVTASIQSIDNIDSVATGEISVTSPVVVTVQGTTTTTEELPDQSTSGASSVARGAGALLAIVLSLMH